MKRSKKALKELVVKLIVIGIVLALIFTGFVVLFL